MKRKNVHREKRELPRAFTDPKSWDKDFQRNNSGQSLIAKGCHPQALLYFLQRAQRSDYFSSQRKRELDQLKCAFGKVMRQSERYSVNLQQLAGKLSDAGRVSEWLRSEAIRVTEVKNCGKLIAEARSVRRTTPLLDIVPLCLYCQKASKDKATDEEIAEFINAGRNADPHSPSDKPSSGRALRAVMKRAEENTRMQYLSIDRWMEVYVATGAHRRFYFDSWLQEMRRLCESAETSHVESQQKIIRIEDFEP